MLVSVIRTLGGEPSEPQVSGIHTIQAADRFRVFPNPVRDILNIQGTAKDNLGICIYDIYGGVVMKKEINEPVKNGIELQFADKSARFYILRVTQGAYVYQTKIFVEE